jgi:hypothetical protein
MLAVCLPVLLEAGCRARDARAHEEVLARLLDLQHPVIRSRPYFMQFRARV